MGCSARIKEVREWVAEETDELTLSNFHVQGASVGAWEKAWAEEDKDGTSDERRSKYARADTC